MMPRRGLLTALGLAAAGGKAKPSAMHGPPLMAVWEREECPGCGRDVMFLPRQRRNRCGWCGRRVRHGLVE